jgi:hypothetical protein
VLVLRDIEEEPWLDYAPARESGGVRGLRLRVATGIQISSMRSR